MTYPYPTLLPLLEMRCTPDVYRELTKRYRHASGGSSLPPHPTQEQPYWDVIRVQRYAECPFCAMSYEEPADTYTVLGWRASLIMSKVLYVSHTTPCAHLLGIHRFINLHGHLPTELSYWGNDTGEVPVMTPWFFPKRMDTYAVLHALPICRIDGAEFVPCYTVFSLSYFSALPAAVLRKHYQSEMKLYGHDREFVVQELQNPWPSAKFDPLYDLAAWAQRGQLGWLDVTDSALPLRLGKETSLPALYRNIQGTRQRYLWHNGQITLYRT